MIRSSVRALSLLALIAFLAPARPSAAPGCGTHLERAREEGYLHHQADRAPAPDGVRVLAAHDRAGNVPAKVLASVPSPQYPGVYQIDAEPAAGTPGGDQPLVVVANGIRSNEARVRIP